MMYCEICGKRIYEDDDDASDTDMGYVHDDCLDNWIDDEEGRRADWAFDTAGDR